MNEPIQDWQLELAEKIADWLISDEGGAFSDNLLDEEILAGIAKIIRDETKDRLKEQQESA